MLSPKTYQRSILFLSVVLGCALSVSVFFHTMSFQVKLNVGLIIFFTILFNLIIGFVLYQWVYLKFFTYTIKSRIILLLGTALAGMWFVFAIPLFSGIHAKKDVIVLFCDVITLSFLFFTIGIWLFAKPLKYDKVIEISKWTWLLYASPMILVWTLYLFAYWPGSLSVDSVNQWEQMIAFNFNDWHPVFHTLTNWLITRFWLSPAAIALTQIVAMGLVLAWGLVEQRRYGAPRWLPWFTIILIVLIPSNGLMVITLWKDVFYSVSVVAMTVLVFKITMTRGRWIQQSNTFLFLSLTSVLVALFRHNGALVAFGTLILLLITYREYRKRFFSVLIITITVWLAIRGPLYDVLGVDKTSTMSGQPGVGMALAHLIARYTNTDTTFLPQDRALLLKIRPEQNWPYECQLETNLFFTKLDWANLKEYTPDLAVLSVKLIYRNPGIFFDHVVCTSSFIYQITRTPDSLYEPMETGVISNKFGLIRDSKFIGLKNIIDHFPNQSNQFYNWIFWRVPFWGYLLFTGVVVYSVRSKNWKTVLVLAPVFLNMLPFIFMAVLQSFRYVYPTLIVGVLMSGFFLFTDIQPEVVR